MSIPKYAKESKYYTPISVENLKDERKLLMTQIEGYNQFSTSLQSVIPSQFEQQKTIEVNKAGIKYFHYGFRFSNVVFTKVKRIDANGQSTPITPNFCKTAKETYSINIDCTISGYQYFTNIDDTVTPEETFTIENGVLGAIPCPVGSKFCTIAPMDSISRIQIEEDPSDLGGYYIINGSEKALVATKSVIKNAPQFHRLNKDGIAIKCDITSQYGDGFDTSHYMIIQLMTDNSIIIRIDINHKVALFLPFQVIYKLFNFDSDEEIFNTILPNYDPNNNRHKKIATSLRKAFNIDFSDNRKDIVTKNRFKSYFNDKGRIEENPVELTLKVADVINAISTGTTFVKYNTNRNNIASQQGTVNKILDTLDRIIFPHIGTDVGSRANKMKYLGSLIYRAYGVKLGDNPSDRNSLANQVIATTQLSLIMSFKTVFNLTIVTKIIREIQKNISSTDNPRNIVIKNLINSNLKNDDLLKNFCKVIKAGNNPKIKINKQSTNNRLITTLLERNNRTATLSTLRSMQTTKSIGGKTNDAVINSRTPHPTQSGIICPIKSVEGGNAGIQSDLAISVEVTDIIFADEIKQLIMNDKNVAPIEQEGGSRVILNGAPICKHANTKAFANQLRELRREGVIHRHTSIIYHALDNGDLEICTQKGRAIRPLVIVYNNFDEHIRDFKNVKFRQWVKYTEAHHDLLVKNKINLESLIRDKIVEMISPIEYKNIYVADSIERFAALEDNPCHRFTHVDLPLSNFGISVLACPHINHSATVRTAYEGNQRRQTLGIPILNWYATFYNKLSIAFNSYKPITETLINKYIRTDGGPIIMLIQAAGNNQEDSLIVNETFAEYGRFSINYQVSYIATLEANQYFGTPLANTKNQKSNNYSHLIDGMPARGTVIYNKMPIIGIVERDNKDNSVTYDRSMIYKKNTPVIVDDISKPFNVNGYKSIAVRTHSVRPVQAGDKFSSRSGGKAIISGIENTERIPTSASGICPDAIINNHAFPSRMILNQMFEGEESKFGAYFGVNIDTSVFVKPNIDAITEKMNKLGISTGNEVFYDDITGERITNKLFVATMFYQRLSKMINDQSSAVDKPTIDVRTQQTIRGINNSGGTKFGEMEKDCWFCIGSMDAIESKMFKDCDGRMLYVCNRCKNVAAVNEDCMIYRCNNCINNKSSTTFSEIPSSYATFGLINTLQILGIGAKFYVEPPSFVVAEPSTAS